MKKPDLSSKKNLHKVAKKAKIELWAQDEVHFQQYGSRCRMWVPKEVKEPILNHHPTRKSVGYFGAVHLGSGRMMFRREQGKFNALTFWEFMKQLCRRARRTGKKIVLLVDNARYHHAKLHKEWRATHKKYIELLYLPPYSPDLNPIERLWKLTRRICVHNRYFSELSQVMNVVEGQFVKWAKPNDTVGKLCAII
jgi:hypothetical protein